MPQREAACLRRSWCPCRPRQRRSAHAPPPEFARCEAAFCRCPWRSLPLPYAGIMPRPHLHFPPSETAFRRLAHATTTDHAPDCGSRSGGSPRVAQCGAGRCRRSRVPRRASRHERAGTASDRDGAMRTWATARRSTPTRSARWRNATPSRLDQVWQYFSSPLFRKPAISTKSIYLTS